MTVESAPAEPAAPIASGEPVEQPSGGDAPAAIQDATAAVEAASDDVARITAELETANKTRIPDLQRQMAKAQEAEKTAKAEAMRVHSEWREWARANVSPEKWEQIEASEQEQTGRVLQTQAARAETLEVINDAWENDDRDFARFLKKQAQVARVTRATLPTLREMFNDLHPGSTTPAPPTAPAPAAAPAAKTPPRVLGAGAAPSTASEPAAKPGDTPQSLFRRAFSRDK